MFSLFKKSNAQHTTTGSLEHLPGAIFKMKYEETPESVILDVRTPAEFQQGHIPGSINIDFLSPGFSSRVASLDTSKTYFLVCRSGNRSGQAGKLMSEQGYQVKNLIGGLGSWPLS